MRNRTYRYFAGKPLYPFGYGLTYGDVSAVAAAARKTEGGVEVEITLRNDGKTDTDEIAQVYCQNEGSPNAPAHPRLVAFQRVRVPAGQTVRVTLPVTARSLLVVDESGALVSEGTPVFYAGVGQPDARTRELTGHASIRVEM